MKARVKATGKIVEVQPLYEPDEYITDKGVYYDILEIELLDEYSPDYWTRLEHQYAGMAMQGLLSSGKLNIIMENSDVLPEGIAIVSRDFARALVKKVRYEEENPKELEGLKKKLEASEIEKTRLENKIKLLKEERK